ncbi:MAG TPA: hypothetical protein ENJ95_02155 [Bacteroidetes bacterium]|nr:hypothetical protein [Bacteroidota bacterium]
MGVTIHYRGRLRRPEDIQAITDELEDICCSAGWKYSLLDFREPEKGDLPFRGIVLQPHPKSESIWMLFQDDGKMAHPFSYPSDSDPDGLPWSFTKTQFAGADTHMAVCRLLQYLAKRWFSVFEVFDEAEYYQTGDDRELRRQLGVINEAINALEKGLSEGPPLEEGESIEDRITKILEDLQRKQP